MIKPEDQARQKIDALLTAAGWVVQRRDQVNLHAGRGIAVREFPLASGYGFADYLLCVDAKAAGVSPVPLPRRRNELRRLRRAANFALPQNGR